MTQHIKTMIITMAVALMLGSPALAGKNDVVKGGKSWIADALATDDNTVELNEAIVAPQGHQVVDSTGAVLGQVTSLGLGYTINVGVDLPDGRLAILAVTKTGYPTVVALLSESTDCSGPYYTLGYGRGPNAFFVPRSAVGPDSVLYAEDEGGVLAGNIRLMSTWNVGQNRCDPFGQWRKDTIPMFAAKDLSGYVTPFGLE